MDISDTEPFTDSGESSDEIVLIFDDGKKLYVSENFLSYASPVFKAMFQHDFKERKTREVSMKEKSFDDFLEFLLCLHPGVQKSIDNGNVLQIVALAEEYQVKVSVTRCQKVMQNWLTRESESAATCNNSYIIQIETHAATCLNILTKAVACGYKELITYAIERIARFGYAIFTGTDNGVPVPRPQQLESVFGRQSGPFGGFGIAQPVGNIPVYNRKSQQICKRLFESLPEDIKTRLLLERLKLCDNGQIL